MICSWDSWQDGSEDIHQGDQMQRSDLKALREFSKDVLRFFHAVTADILGLATKDDLRRHLEVHHRS